MYDFEDFLPWILMLAPGGVGFLLAASGQPEWASLCFVIGSLAILSYALPSVVLFLRNPTGKRIDAITSLDDAWSGWGLVFLKAQRLRNTYANEAMFKDWYGLYRNYAPTPEAVLNWYGKDAYRVASQVAALRRQNHDATDVLTRFAEAKVTDFDRMLEYIGVLGPEAALETIQNDIPLEYAKALALPTQDHD